MTYDLIVKNGTIVTATNVYKGDIGVSKGKIVALGDKLSGRVKQTVDAKGCYVLPGIIDAHTHFELPVGDTVTADNFETASRAAALGGVTTFVDFATQDKGERLVNVLKSRQNLAEGRCAVDYGFHVGITDWTARTLSEIPKIIKLGVPSFKTFMVYEERGHMSDDGILLDVLGEVSNQGALVTVHAENHAICRFLTKRCQSQGNLGIEYLPRSRPNFSEGEAISRAIALCEEVDGNLYIVHMSTKEGSFAVMAGRARGVNVLAETCPQYLMLEQGLFDEKRGHDFATCPPLRSEIDNLALWSALRDGNIEVVATDHCSWTRKQKDSWQGDFTKVPYGMPGVETLLGMVYHGGVSRDLITLERMVQVLSTNPALIMGLFPRKGTIQIGSDADLVLFNPKKRKKLTARSLHMGADYSPYEGWQLQGWPTHTILKGKVIVEKGRYIGEAGDGRYLSRSLPGEPLS